MCSPSVVMGMKCVNGRLDQKNLNILQKPRRIEFVEEMLFNGDVTWAYEYNVENFPQSIEWRSKNESNARKLKFHSGLLGPIDYHLLKLTKEFS